VSSRTYKLTYSIAVQKSFEIRASFLLRQIARICAEQYRDYSCIVVDRRVAMQGIQDAAYSCRCSIISVWPMSVCLFVTTVSKKREKKRIQNRDKLRGYLLKFVQVVKIIIIRHKSWACFCLCAYSHSSRGLRHAQLRGVGERLADIPLSTR